MFALFFIFSLAIFYSFLGFRKLALLIAMICLLLSLGMFWWHISDVLQILL